VRLTYNFITHDSLNRFTYLCRKDIESFHNSIMPEFISANQAISNIFAQIYFWESCNFQANNKRLNGVSRIKCGELSEN